MEPKTISLPKTTTQILEYSLLATSFLIPFFVSGPQLLTGTVVNTLLFLLVSQVSSKKTLPIVILPSIGAVLNGILFGKFTVFLLYFLPFIWIGNYALIQSFGSLLKKKSFLISVFASSFLKCIILFSIAYLFTAIKIVPQIFLQLMGLFQLYTAVLGGILAFGIHTILNKKI
ncbi:MAG: hypothetical protein V1922_04765 [bacterium]